MEDIYENILTGLQEAVDDSTAKEKKLRRHLVAVIPVKEYTGAASRILNMMEMGCELTKKFPFVQVE